MSRSSTFLWAAPLFGVVLAIAAGIAAPLTMAYSIGPAGAVRLTALAVLSAIAAGWFRHRSTTRFRYSASRTIRSERPMS